MTHSIKRGRAIRVSSRHQAPSHRKSKSVETRFAKAQRNASAQIKKDGLQASRKSKAADKGVQQTDKAAEQKPSVVSESFSSSVAVPSPSPTPTPTPSPSPTPPAAAGKGDDHGKPDDGMRELGGSHEDTSGGTAAKMVAGAGVAIAGITAAAAGVSSVLSQFAAAVGLGSAVTETAAETGLMKEIATSSSGGAPPASDAISTIPTGSPPSVLEKAEAMVQRQIDSVKNAAGRATSFAERTARDGFEKARALFEKGSASLSDGVNKITGGMQDALQVLRDNCKGCDAVKSAWQSIAYNCEGCKVMRQAYTDASGKARQAYASAADKVKAFFSGFGGPGGLLPDFAEGFFPIGYKTPKSMKEQNADAEKQKRDAEGLRMQDDGGFGFTDDKVRFRNLSQHAQTAAKNLNASPLFSRTPQGWDKRDIQFAIYQIDDLVVDPTLATETPLLLGARRDLYSVFKREEKSNDKDRAYDFELIDKALIFSAKRKLELAGVLPDSQIQGDAKDVDGISEQGKASLEFLKDRIDEKNVSEEKLDQEKLREEYNRMKKILSSDQRNISTELGNFEKHIPNAENGKLRLTQAALRLNTYHISMQDIISQMSGYSYGIPQPTILAGSKDDFLKCKDAINRMLTQVVEFGSILKASGREYKFESPEETQSVVSHRQKVANELGALQERLANELGYYYQLARYLNDKTY